MRLALSASLMVVLMAGSAHAAEWRAQRIATPARVTAVETVDGQARVNAGGLWYRIELNDNGAALVFADALSKADMPEGALPDGRVTTGTRDVARAWLGDPTDRYGHGVLGDRIEASSLVIEARDGKRHIVRLKNDAVFEDLEPRLADLDGDGHDEIVVVKSYLKQGSALAVIALRQGRYDIVAETTPLASPNRWLNPAGIGDFTGGGKIGIALVRQPHVIGELELWIWSDNRLRRIATLPGLTNHIIGSRALHMAAVADFDGNGVIDIALPSLDRGRLRIVSFAPARDIAEIALPSKAATNTAVIAMTSGPPALALGLSDGSLALVRRD